MRSGTLLPLLLLALSAAAASMPPPAAARPVLRVEPGGHVGAVHQVLFADEFGRRVVTAGQDKAVRVWDAETGRQVRVLRGQIGEGREGQIYAAAVSGGTLATAGSDPAEVDARSGEYKTRKRVLAIRLLDLASGRVRRLLPGHEETILGLAFSPDGATLVSTSYDGTVRAWDPDSGRQVRAFAAAPGKAVTLSLAFSPDGATVAGAGEDGAVRLWEAATGKLRGALPAGKSPARAVAFSRDGALACGSADGRVRLWSQAPRPGAAPDATLEHADGAAVTSVAFTPDGRTLLSGSGETEDAGAASARSWSVPEGRPKATFRGHSDTVVSVAAAPDGALAASADASGEVFLWDPGTGREGRRLAGTGERPFSVAWSADGKKVAWGTTRDGRLSRAFDLYRNRPEAPGGDAGWGRAALEQGGRTLSATPERDAVVVRQGGREAARIKDKDWQPGERVRCFAWAPQNRVVVGTTYGLALYDGASGRRLAEYPGHAGIVEAVSVSGRYLASASADQTVRVWNLDERGAAVAPLVSLFCGADGEWVAWNERSGYYAASAAGDDIIGWHVNRGPDRAAEFHRAFQFRGRFYQPDVVCRLLEAGSVAGAVKMAAGLPVPPGQSKPSAAPDPAAEVARVPAVEVVRVEGAAEDGEGGYRAAEPKVTLRVRVANAADPARTEVRLRVNRPETARNLYEIPEGTGGTRSLGADLRPGQNVLTVVARAPGGAESAPAVVRVRYEPSGRSPAAAEPALHVLAVGVSLYADPAINDGSPIYFADRDAKQVAEFYRRQAGRLAKNVAVRTLTNQEATRARVEAELARLTREVGPDDRVIVFLSGHGFYIEDDFFFAPHDAKLSALAGSAVDAEKMLRGLAALRCADVLLMLDHCYSGGVNLKVVDAAASAARSRGRDARNEQGRRLREANLFTLTASMPDQESYEHRSWQNGAFTYALLEALGGKARTRDGYADLTGVRDYLLERVPGLVKSVGLPPQVPKLFYPPTIDDLVPARIRVARVK